MRVTRIVHAKRREDAIFQEPFIRTAGNLLENCTKQEVARVAVMELCSGFKFQIPTAILLGKVFDAIRCSARRAIQETRGGYEIRDTRSVREQLPDSDAISCVLAVVQQIIRDVSV